jgi:hypothetical protein
MDGSGYSTGDEPAPDGAHRRRLGAVGDAGFLENVLYVRFWRCSG